MPNTDLLDPPINNRSSAAPGARWEYLVTYRAIKGSGRCFCVQERPIESEADVRELEQTIRQEYGIAGASVMGFQLLNSPKPFVKPPMLSGSELVELSLREGFVDMLTNLPDDPAAAVKQVQFTLMRYYREATALAELNHESRAAQYG